MSVKRKKYSKQFKLDAIQMYENGEKSMAQVDKLRRGWVPAPR